MSEVAYATSGAHAPAPQKASARLAEGLEAIRSQIDRLEARLSDVTVPATPEAYPPDAATAMQSPVAHLAESAWGLSFRIERLIERIDV